LHRLVKQSARKIDLESVRSCFSFSLRRRWNSPDHAGLEQRDDAGSCPATKRKAEPGGGVAQAAAREHVPGSSSAGDHPVAAAVWRRVRRLSIISPAIGDAGGRRRGCAAVHRARVGIQNGTCTSTIRRHVLCDSKICSGLGAPLPVFLPE
jgi:hypothetical protein